LDAKEIMEKPKSTMSARNMAVLRTGVVATVCRECTHSAGTCQEIAREGLDFGGGESILSREEEGTIKRKNVALLISICVKFA